VVANLPKLFWGMDLSARWTLGTGLPYAGTIGYYDWYRYRPEYGESGWWRPRWDYIEGTRDAFRYPAYHRLDAGLSKSWQLARPVRCELTGFLDVTNLYNAKNVLLYYWEKDDATGLPIRSNVGMIPILPTIGVKVRF
jgi:hypothetical protein